MGKFKKKVQSISERLSWNAFEKCQRYWWLSLGVCIDQFSGLRRGLFNEFFISISLNTTCRTSKTYSCSCINRRYDIQPDGMFYGTFHYGKISTRYTYNVQQYRFLCVYIYRWMVVCFCFSHWTAFYTFFELPDDVAFNNIYLQNIYISKSFPLLCVWLFFKSFSTLPINHNKQVHWKNVVFTWNWIRRSYSDETKKTNFHVPFLNIQIHTVVHIDFISIRF